MRDRPRPLIVELGTIRSYTHGGLPGCNSDDLTAWTPTVPKNWDWGAGCFSRMAAECLGDLNPIIHTVDVAASHVQRCKRITQEFAHLFRYNVADSTQFLRSVRGPIDLLYLDTGDMTPIEPTARHQLHEARAVVSRDLMAHGGVVLLDDVRNQTPRTFGDGSGLGKSKYALPYLLRHGFQLDMDEYQVLLVRRVGQ